MARIALVDLPFAPLDRPNLGLESVAAVLRSGQRHDARTLYPKYGYARRIGIPLYDRIASGSSCDKLIGDLAFCCFTTRGRRGGSGPIDLDGSVARRSASRLRDSDLHDIGDLEISNLLKESHAFTLQVAESVAHGRFDAVGFNLMFFVRPALAVAAQIKAMRPDIMVIFGGVYCDPPMGEELFEAFEFVDAIVQGEGEPVVEALLAALESETCAPPPGVLLRHRINVERPPPRRVPPIRNLDSLPIPDYSSWLSVFREADFPADPIVTLETSRGCWYGEKMHCVFCGLNASAMAYRCKSPDRVSIELASVARLGITDAEATDLILSRTYFKDLLPELGRTGNRIRLFFETRPNLGRTELAVLSAANVRMIQAGIESLSSEHLRCMRKGSRGHHGVRLLKWSFEENIHVVWNILFGLPVEKAEWFEAMARLVPLIHHLQPPLYGCVQIVMNRFSPIYDEHRAHGFTGRSPAHAYAHAFPELSEDQLGKIAYYFDAEPKDDGTKSATLSQAVKRWQQVHSESYCFQFDAPEGRIIVDGRAGGKGETLYCLSELETRLVDESDAGVPRTELVERLRRGWSSAEVIRHLDMLLDHGLILEVDDFLVSAAVGMNHALEWCRDLSTPLRIGIGRETYKATARQFSDNSRRVPARSSET